MPEFCFSVIYSFRFCFSLIFGGLQMQLPSCVAFACVYNGLVAENDKQLLHRTRRLPGSHVNAGNILGNSRDLFPRIPEKCSREYSRQNRIPGNFTSLLPGCRSSDFNRSHLRLGRGDIKYLQLFRVKVNLVGSMYGLKSADVESRCTNVHRSYFDLRPSFVCNKFSSFQ